jgi:hypothetical protein
MNTENWRALPKETDGIESKSAIFQTQVPLAPGRKFQARTSASDISVFAADRLR